MKKNIRNQFLLVGVIIFAIGSVLSGKLDAQSAELPLSELNCQKLNVLSLDKMNTKQILYSNQCDSAEAERAWEKQYGKLLNNGLSDAVVYDE